MNPIGIMQGRLSPPTGGRIQSFPTGSWREEFPLAKELGLERIEWIYEYESSEANPLRTDEGLAEVQQVSARTGVAVRSICADYFMASRLVDRSGTPVDSVVEHLKWLIDRTAMLGAKYIVLPFVDESSLGTPDEIEALSTVLKSVAVSAEGVGVEIHLETDLEPSELASLVSDEASGRVLRVTYDIGNEAALGHDPETDLSLLGQWLGSVHIKDRVLGGSTVPLGQGAADFDTCFRMFGAASYRGPLILQAARGSDESGTIQGYLDFLRPLMRQYFGA